VEFYRVALEGSWKEAQAAAERADERANFSATELAKCHQIIEKLQVCPPKWPIISHAYTSSTRISELNSSSF
jgi:hypothetical protein